MGRRAVCAEGAEGRTLQAEAIAAGDEDEGDDDGRALQAAVCEGMAGDGALVEAARMRPAERRDDNDDDD